MYIGSIYCLEGRGRGAGEIQGWVNDSWSGPCMLMGIPTTYLPSKK